MAFDLNSKLSNWLAPKQQDVQGQSVTYTRSGNSVTLTAIYADLETAGATGGAGAHDQYERIRLGIKASELIINSVTVTPARGDTVTLNSKVYAITAEAEPEYRYLDPEREWYDIELWSGNA